METKNLFIEICSQINKEPPRVFVETGTYLGDNLSKIKGLFREIHSIEFVPKLANDAREKFKNEKHINIHIGDSATVIEEIGGTIQERCLFYLDAHYSGGATGEGMIGDNGCPLLRELAAIAKTRGLNINQDIIVIDDMRLMGKVSYGGLWKDSVYPLERYDFRHITKESILEALENPTNINLKLFIRPDVLVIYWN